jgi:hypothetical protein
VVAGVAQPVLTVECDWCHTLSSLVASPVFPGGLNSGQKDQKGPEKKKSWPEEFVAEFWPNFAKSGSKGAKEIF